MKRLFMILATVMLFCSCEDFLTVNPTDALVADNYYTSEAALEANTATLYGRVWWDFHSQFMWLAGDMMSGDLYYTYDQEGHFYYNSVGAGNNYLNYGWIGLYRVVSFANSIINDMPAPAAAHNLPQEAIDKALAEARFARAMAYYFLTEYWGEVPIIENSTELITSSDPTAIYVNKNTQSDLYRFMCEDLEFAVAKLPTAAKPGRVTSWSAKGLLAKVYLTRATFENNADYYTQAKTYAKDVIDNYGFTPADTDYASLFEVAGNNTPETLFSIQCMVGNYGDGSSRNVSWSRSARIADQTWGAGKGPTLSLQNTYEEGDTRRPYVFMTLNDYYPNLDKANGGYTYLYSYRNPDDLETQVEASMEMLAHVKKYIIGKAADCDGQVGLNQDAGNNIHLLRLSDVYMVYAEACIGTGNATSDPEALAAVNAIRTRSGLAAIEGELTFERLIQERRKEFALEGINWMDVKRMYYRNHEAAIAYLNDMERDRIYRFDWTLVDESMTTADRYVLENQKSNYVLSWQTLLDSEDHTSRVQNIVVTDASMYLPIPAAVTTNAPILNEPAVPYYTE